MTSTKPNANDNEMSLLYVMDFPNGTYMKGRRRTGTLAKLNAPLGGSSKSAKFQGLFPIVGIGPNGYRKGAFLRRSEQR